MVAALTLVLWFCFGWFREQFCLILCPYGRLQSALTDDDTLVIGYDERRGEPRGAKGRSEGDCVDCRRCVSVCPTGIDIRDGLQMECIGCSACVDACDDIMLKVGRAPGLVRYDSLNGFAGKKRRLYRPRTLLYLGLGLLGLIALSLTAWQQATPFTVEVSRMSGPPFYAEAGTIRNHYRMRFINKRNQPATFRLLLEKAPPGYALSGADIDIQVPPLGEVARPVILLAPADAYHGPCEVTIGTITDPGRVHSQHAVRFLGP
jgi:cytochrome c oxidase accessory protein FixG